MAELHFLLLIFVFRSVYFRANPFYTDCTLLSDSRVLIVFSCAPIQKSNYISSINFPGEFPGVRGDPGYKRYDNSYVHFIYIHNTIIIKQKTREDPHQSSQIICPQNSNIGIFAMFSCSVQKWTKPLNFWLSFSIIFSNHDIDSIFVFFCRWHTLTTTRISPRVKASIFIEWFLISCQAAVRWVSPFLTFPHFIRIVIRSITNIHF